MIAEAAAASTATRTTAPAALTEAIAERFAVPAGHIAVGCGSVGVLKQLIEAVSDPGAEVLYAWRSFEAYPPLADLAGATSVRVPLRDETHDLAAMAAAITPRTRLILVCNPNNPTGTVVRERGADRLPRPGPGRLPGRPGRGLPRVHPRRRRPRRHRPLPRPPQRGRAAHLLQGLRAGGAAVGFLIGHEPVAEAVRKTMLPSR